MEGIFYDSKKADMYDQRIGTPLNIVHETARYTDEKPPRLCEIQLALVEHT